MSLGPGIPESPNIMKVPVQSSRHPRGESYAVRFHPILGGLHHDYFLAQRCMIEFCGLQPSTLTLKHTAVQIHYYNYQKE